MSEDASPHLLLVEDSDTQALVFRRTLEGFGFTVDRTRTAEDALVSLNEALPDLLVVDYRLPGMNGDELVRILRQTGHTRTLPIIMLTSDEASEVERQGLDSGANAYVPKASGPQLLVSRMRSLLRQRRSVPGNGTAGGFRQARLLVAVADPIYRDWLRGLLTGDGHAVSVAGDEQAMLAAVTEEEFDGVLVGPAPEGEDPFAWVRALDRQRQADSAGFEIAALSEVADPAQTLAGLGAGADDVLPSRDERDMLLVRVRSILRRKLARDDEAAGAARERERELALAHARAQAEASDALAAANRELEAANAQLRETQAQLVQSAKMASLGELVAGIAHEINNPLAFILAHHATVERAVQDATTAEDDTRTKRLAKAAERLGSIRTGLVRIQDLVVKLRRFSRLDDGEWSLVDIPEAIDSVLTLLQPKIPATVTIERRYGPVRTLESSPALVNQVVMNIISNAVDAVDPTTGRIVIETSTRDDRFFIAITDNGPGIPPEVRERVFEPFFTTKDVGSGTGLGLAIAYGVVRSHGGEITIESGDEGGARFLLAVPLHRQ
ncbi:ATP-binding protein [Sphingomonas sp. ACRSK]|uniref:ATP-binding protein n=1 Tax=Sphingomonas sp. ACRSK TaxID=2918213 RepID=UPI001EF5016F|nr:response regulator [Sphingomonas sp. ACRSK]